MHYPVSVYALQQRFQSILPLSKAQIIRLCLLCYGLFLAKKLHLTFIARVLPQPIQQDSRVRWISRLLIARFMRIEIVYHPILKDMLIKMKWDDWHLVIDRTPFIPQQVDLLIISINYHKHAIPLVWCEVPFGGAPLAVAVHLLRQCPPLLPPQASVIFHGDTEFGGREMILALQDIGWDFILAQPNKSAIWLPGSDHPTLLGDVPLNRTRSIASIHLFSEKPLAGLQLVAFPQTRRDRQGRIKREAAYLVTSLPLTRPIKRLGRRRWGAEPMHKNFKSGGLDLTDTRLRSPHRRHGLLIVLALVYLLNICLGRYLCQTRKRRQIDSKSHRHLSLFRLGWDFIVHSIICGLYIHIPLRLPP